MITKEMHTLSFTLDETAGVTVMNIAQEHLLYNYSPTRAVKMITDSLTGCPLPLALEILKGDMVIFVCEEEGKQFFSVGNRDEYNDTIFPKLNCVDFVQKKSKSIVSDAMGISAGIRLFMNRMKYSGGLHIRHDFSNLINLAQGNSEGVLKEIRNSEDFEQLELLIETTKNFIIESMKVLAVADFMKKTWHKDFDGVTDHMFEAGSDITELGGLYSEMLRSHFASYIENDELDAYISAVHKIDEIISEGITPVNIMDNYSAGWLSPDGTFYGVNGEIANMLHNNIASALYDKGIIPHEEEYEGNPDRYLLTNGWVKIHDNNISYESNLNQRLGFGENIFMNDLQIDIIEKYIQVHHKGIIKLFFQPLSGKMFQMLAKGNKVKFYTDYFMGV